MQRAWLSFCLFALGCARGGADPGGLDAGHDAAEMLDRCPADLIECGELCVDTSSDAANCGGCGLACDPGKPCVDSQCGAECPTGQTSCAASCVDTQNDAANCGDCGIACRAGAACSGGTCACPSGQIICGAGCVDPASDAMFCGASADCMGANAGQACTGVCVDEACAASCPAGTMRCMNGATPICADLTNHPLHCGACGNACTYGVNERGTCAASTCSSVCDTGYLDCDAADGCETDGRTDEASCGACGNACAAGRSCIAGVCVAATENCTNGTDDDGDLAADCSDTDCASAPSCMTGGGPCSGLVSLTTATGTIQDGSGSAAYTTYMDCSWRIQIAGAPYVQLDFRELNTESGYDFVTVYEGTSASGRLLGRFSGTSLPGIVVATGDAMFVTWTTDGSINYQGFRADYSQRSTPPETCANGADEDTDGAIDCADAECAGHEACTAIRCTGNVNRTAPTGRVQDGSGTADYTNSMSCSWTITVPGATSIALRFTAFDTESGYDYVRVYQGTSSGGTRVAEVSGTSLPGVATVSGSSMFVTWTTDSTIVYDGFIADYTASF